MRTSQHPLPSITPVLSKDQYAKRHRWNRQKKEHSYPRLHPRYAHGDDLMRTIDERYEEPHSMFISSLHPIVEEDETTAINLHAAIRLPSGGGRNLRRVSLTTVVVDLAFIIRRKLQKLRAGNNAKTAVVFDMLT